MACCTPVSGSSTTLSGGVVDQPDRQRHAQLAAAGLGQLPAEQAGPDEVQLGLAHGALQAEQQPVVEVGRVIEPVLVADQGVADMAQISSSRCQSALLRASRDTSRPSTIPARPMPTSATRRWKPSRSAAEAPDWPWSVSMVTICSAGQPSATARLPQRVLAGGGLGVGQHLPQRGLAHIQVGGASQVRGRSPSPRPARSPPLTPALATASAIDGQQPDQFGLDAPGQRGDPALGRAWVGETVGDGRLTRPQPGGDPALLQHRQPEPPPVGVAGQRPGPQLLIPVHDVGSVTGRIVDVIACLHFWNLQRGPAPAPPIAGAP